MGAKMWVPWLNELTFRVERHHFLACWKITNCIQNSRENLEIPKFKHFNTKKENIIQWAEHMIPRERWKGLMKWHGKEWSVTPLFHHQTQGPHFINPATGTALRTKHVLDKCPWDEDVSTEWKLPQTPRSYTLSRADTVSNGLTSCYNIYLSTTLFALLWCPWIGLLSTWQSSLPTHLSTVSLVRWQPTDGGEQIQDGSMHSTRAAFT